MVLKITLFLVDITKVVENGKVAQNLLDEVNITLNKKLHPYETLSPFKTNGIRISTAAIVARALVSQKASKVAELLSRLWKTLKTKRCAQSECGREFVDWMLFRSMKV